MVLPPTYLMSSEGNNWHPNHTMVTLGTHMGFRNLGAHGPPMVETYFRERYEESAANSPLQEIYTESGPPESLVQAWMQAGGSE